MKVTFFELIDSFRYPRIEKILTFDNANSAKRNSNKAISRFNFKSALFINYLKLAQDTLLGY
ncbi:hypothetical protein BS732_3188 [Bacillus subtilis MB73/2]|nr:hypothetical protein BS732_3188 [Bacillus subtilis MB73/2]